MNGTRFSEVIESIRSPRMSWALPASREETQDNINRAMLLISIAVASWTLNYLGTADAICFLISSDVVGLPVYALAEAFVIAMFNDETPISIDTDYMNQNCQTISCSTQGDETQYTDPSNTVADNDSSALADYVEVLQTTRAWVLGPLRLEPVRANRNYAFTDEDRDILNIFKSGLRVYTHSFYHRTGRQFPEITQSLVSIQMWLKPTAKTYICISGFSNPQDIEAFDKVLSKKGYKDACRPLEFCYELSHITLSASSGVYDVKSSSTGTLCGSIAIFVQSNGPQIKSTIGGLIEVDSQSFALTTKHRPETEMVTDSEEDSPSLADLMLKLLEDRGVEELTPQKSPPASVDSSNKGAMTPLVDEVDTWEDWDLIPIEKARRLPNFVPNNKSSENTTRSRPVTKFVDFDTNSFYNALPWPVLIISGMSGVLDGLLSSNPSYMHCGIDSSHEVWTVKLKQHDLQAGDSGSWVVRKSDHGLLGMVVARSAGTAYMVSFDKIRESIERSRSLAPHSVELPKFSTKRSLSQRRAQLMSDINEGLSQYHEATPPDNAMTQNNPVGLRLSSLVSPLGSALQTLQNLMSTVIGPMKDVLKPYMENPPARIPRSGGESEPLFNIANLPNSFPSLLQALDTRTILDPEL
ncbi:hypothetical protein JMJ77_0014014 [Colletotrichum scovillei]|uniref:Uncharacterized protein n=1 Tax=Colletotrichum scovillei TaxID=1209932 RepID=A0A9P7R5V4_9PEZI|nr:hypothetical protein JMJ77_0014014 [Colletotrichum scovillei]KAG7065543.1 hypothetical protein JMJ78_0012291 [Colletotrichum scovillei]KAG7068143.1 hypothetical protein JMJ76_0007834 [Colletotrichum scovillei]